MKGDPALETLPPAPLFTLRLMVKLRAVLTSVRVAVRGERALAFVGGREGGGEGEGGKLKSLSYIDVLRMKIWMKAYSVVCV